MSPLIGPALEEVERLLHEDRLDAAWAALHPLRPWLGSAKSVALAWLDLLHAALPPGNGWRLDFASIMEAWPHDPDVVAGCCEVLLDDAASLELDEGAHPSAELVPELASECLEQAEDLSTRQERRLLALTARAWRRIPGLKAEDREAAREAHQAWLDLDPAEPEAWRALGALAKLQGRFADGVEALRKALELGGPHEATLCDLGICATGAGDHEAAREAWEGLGMETVRDERFGVRVPGLDLVQVRLTSRGPLTRFWPGASFDDLGMYDHAWALPFSPCHGMVMTPTVFNTSADSGDVVLWDLPPFGVRRDGQGESPRHLHLAVLKPSTRPILRFVARQPRPGALADLDTLLPDGTLVSVASESATLICRDCARGVTAHEHALMPPPATGVVYGKLVARSVDDLPALRERWEAATAAHGIEVACPALYHALNDPAAAAEAEAAWKRLDPG